MSAGAGIEPSVLAERHPSVTQIARYFDYGHLTGDARNVSAEFSLLAGDLLTMIPDSPELTAGLRKLLEAKDCMVRAALPPPGT